MNKLPMPIQDLMRIQDIKRWTVVNTARQQSVAEHTCLVFFLAVEIATRLGVKWNSDTAREIGMKAMLHDIDEIYTGDIPTPAKQRMCGKCKSQLSVEADKQKTKQHEKWLIDTIVKMADIIETTEFIGQYAEGIHAVQVMAHMVNERYKFMEDLPPRYREVMESVILDLELGERKW